MRSLVIAVVFLSVCVFASKHEKYEDDDFESLMVMADDWKPGESMVQVNFHAHCADKANDIINAHLQATFQYIAIATFFRRYDVDIVGVSLMYNAWARLKINNAKMIMMYLIKRGADINFKDIAKPSATEFASPADAFVLTLNKERALAESINALAKVAQKHNDNHMVAFVEEKLVNTQADNIFAVSALINKLQKAKAAGNPLIGLMSVNKQLVKKYKDYKDCTNDTELYRWNY